MKKVNVAGNAFVFALLILCVVPAGAEPSCSITALSDEDLAAGATPINERLLCLEQRVRALENSGAGSIAASLDATSIAKPITFNGVNIGMDQASVVDKKRLLLELSVVNAGADPVLAIVDDNRSSIAVRGEAEPRRFAVQGLAACGGLGWNAPDATAACVERAGDNHWTTLEPGVLYELRLSTDDINREVEGDALSTTIRLLLRQGEDWQMKDLSFARVPIVR